MVNATGPIMVPPGGIFSYNRNGEHVTGFTREELITNLTNLRVANSVKVGDPARDIDQALAGEESYSSPIPVGSIQPKRAGTRLIDRVNSWLATRYAKLSTLKYVNAPEAQKRAAICARCPKNKEWRGCVTCSKDAIRTIERNAVILSQNKRTPLHDRLKACAVAGHENSVATWLTSEFLAHRNAYMDQLPSFCWLRGLE